MAIRLDARELLDDVRQMAWAEGDAMGDADAHAQHLAQDAAQDGPALDRSLRVLALAHARCAEALMRHTGSPVRCGEERGDALRAPSAYVFDLEVPEGFSATTLTYLARLLHEHMAACVLADWLSVAKPQAAPAWAERAAAALSEARRCASNRIGSWAAIRPSVF